MGGDGCVEEIQLCRCEPVAWVTVWWVCSLHGGLDPRPRINFTRKTVRLAGSLMNSAQGWSCISVPLCTTHVYTCCHFIVAAAATHTQCCQLISKSSFSRQCVGRIRDTCSQLTWNLHTHTPHTPGGTFRPNLSYGQALYLHDSCQNKSEVCQPATSSFDICVASLSVVFKIHTSSWHETYIHTLAFPPLMYLHYALGKYYICFSTGCGRKLSGPAVAASSSTTV